MIMDEQGFYPEGTKCKNCGAELSRTDRPGELYAGTYTGLCYKCQNSGPFVVAYLGNGFKRWSFPPHCPSWRRDREEFVGQEGCTLCGGKGRKMIYRPYGQGGPYPENCKTCWPKYLEILEEKGRAA